MKTSGRGIASLVLVGVLVGSVLSAASPPAGPNTSAVPVPHVSEAPDVVSAAQAARSQGSRVEVLDQRTSTRTVFANPDGTETAELTAVATRVRQGNEWRRIDTTLAARSDGRVGPKAAEGGVSFSGGGSTAALASLHDNGRTLSVYWPGELPKPELSGNAATYREVLLGVDLVLLAERNGLQQHLVVKTAAAARNPALAAIRMGMRADGLRVSVDAAGALRAVDGADAEVFSAPPSIMWDAEGRTTRLGVSVVEGGLVLTPDQAFLADPAVVYPVTIDPKWETPRWHQWATVVSGKPGTSYWGRSASPRDPWIAQVGQCYNGNGDCGGIGEARAYFQFDTSFMADKMVVEGPAVKTTAVYGPSCTPRDHVLHEARQPIWSSMNWGNAPQGLGIARFAAPTVYPSCAGAVSVTLPVGAYYSPSNVSVYYLRTVAGQEHDQLTWRRYDPEQTFWTVRYNRAPHRPSALRTDPPLPAPCRWCGGTPYVGDSNIRLIATLSDPDTDAVYPAWRVQVSGAPLDVRDNAWDYKPSGQPHSTDVNLTDKHGRSVGWWVHAMDGHAGSDAASPPAPGSFIVDRKGITVKPGVTSAEYPSDNAWHGAVGSPGVFTFSPGATCNSQNDVPGVCDIDRYIYSWQDPPSGSESVDANALGGSASVVLSPPGDGPRTLYVQSVDRAGHRSTETAQYRIYVRAGNGPRSQWSLESNTNDTAFLGDRHGTLTGTATYGPGAVNTGLHFDGAGTSLMTAPSTVRTDGSFSVAAWVWLERDNNGAVAVEQRGETEAGFGLHYHGQLKKWIFVLPGRDADPQTAWYFIESPNLAAMRTWTHLAGTYDRATGQMTMYINGEQVPTRTIRQTPWNAAGAVQVGRSWPGAVDEVQLFDRVLGPAEVKAIVNRDNVQAGHWKFDDKDGTTAVNSIEGMDSLVLKEGAAFTDDGAINRAVHFDGDNDFAVGGRPAVRTDQSFTVAAWVWADRFVGAGAAMTAVSQDGANNSGFYLAYSGSPNNKWVFLKQSDDTVTPNYVAALASQAPIAGDWVHLAGSYDATSGKMIIYVNGQYGGETTHTGPAWDATGPLTIGRAKFAGKHTDYWPGSVDEVRMYNRVLTPQELEGIVSRDDVPVASWKFDGNSKDESKSGNHGTLFNTPSWTSGQATHPDPADLALSLDGVDDYVKATRPVVDSTKSYSVSAWVRLGKPDTGWRAVASQVGTDAVAFTLGYSGTGGNGGPPDRWAFQIHGSDKHNPSTNRVSSDTTAQVGVWTHLAAVYQAGSREMFLYVNGVQAGYGKLSSPGTFNAQVEFDIGRSMWNDSFVNYFAGGIDDVKVHSRPLFADEVRLMAGRDLALVHDWRLDEPGGTTAADSVGARRATLSGGAAFDQGRAGNAMRFDGTGAASTTGVDLLTDESFTVSAWVKLDKPEACASVCQTSAVSVDGGSGTNTSKFRLGHRIDQDQALSPGKWIFDMPEPNGSVTRAAISTEEGELGTWVFLVGVYDKPAGQIWLYVLTGEEESDFNSGTLRTPWPSTGPLRIGRDHGTTGFWRGSVDEVRLQRGDLDADRIGALYRSYPATAPSPTLPDADKGHWKFDDNTGTTAVDASGREQTATLNDGAGWTSGGRTGPSSWLNGTSGYAETAGPVLATDQSFSVTAWAYLAKTTGGNRVVVAQDRNQVSSFLLMYDEATGKWAAAAPTTDAANPPGTAIVRSAAPATANMWTHLGLVYDADRHHLRLYVNGAAPTVKDEVSLMDSEGSFAIGRGRWNNGNAAYFPGGVDDVRAFGRALSDGEIRKVHDDAPEVLYGYWGFEGNVNDTSWRANPTTKSGTTSFGEGVRGQALRLDGATGSARTRDFGANMVDTFTVSAWAKLSHTEHDATVVSQDGERMSAFLLQYNKNANAWIFGAAAHDADFSTLLYAESPLPPSVNVWTHLTGVYDYPAGQLRLYVNGELVDTKNTPLWPSWRAFTIGRGMQNGAEAGFFPGSLDEVRTHLAILPDAEIKRLAGHPAPAGGQLNRFVNSTGEHYTANSTADHNEPFSPIPRGYHLEGPLGKLLTSQEPGTRMLYACLSGGDEFTSTAENCGGSGATKLADLGFAYTEPPPAGSVPTIAVYRCATASNERFDSLDPTCEGSGNTRQEQLGYTVAYTALTRYTHEPDGEHTTTVYGAPPGYRSEGALGLLAMTAEPGTETLWSCRKGIDEFATTDATCAGAGTKVASLGRVWTDPPVGAASRPLYLCQINNAEWFNSVQSNCENVANATAVHLGHMATTVPVPAPVD